MERKGKEAEDVACLGKHTKLTMVNREALVGFPQIH
jgi:hypothetical protein